MSEPFDASRLLGLRHLPALSAHRGSKSLADRGFNKIGEPVPSATHLDRSFNKIGEPPAILEPGS